MDKNLGQQTTQTNKGKDAKKIAGLVIGETKKIAKNPKVKQSVKELKNALKGFGKSL